MPRKTFGVLRYGMQTGDLSEAHANLKARQALSVGNPARFCLVISPEGQSATAQ
ncbi:hypothetical protein J2X76_005933 [Neorhizobium sp. 2083]|uniref:hypothetical protein n=1 Tax=Neorhizobium sp. 2083 TaxID=2817762 RepID=UPI002857A7C2|nr:hypothetical protein [Neorhizobium sp. 2083]MDR6820733.1 hypothetical protein [Neorhizobium sp. 2083]